MKNLLKLFVLLAIVISVFAAFSRNKIELVHAAAVTLTPATGMPGMEVFITGSAFDLSTVATITWDGAPLTTIPSTVTTSGAGAIPANVSFVVPSAAIGIHTVRISTSSQVYMTASFTISAPTVAISSPAVPTAGLPVGVPITITGSNFEGNKSTIVYFDDISVATVTSSYNGAIEATFAIPDVNNTGAHIIKAVASANSVANLTIIVAPPAIVLSPVTGAVGLNVTVTGTNFKAGGLVSFFLNGAVLTADNPISANGAGSFAVTLSVPDVLTGINTIKASSYAQLYATAPYTVIAPVIVLSPATGPVGLNVTITGTNFKANSLVTFLMNGATLTTASPVTANSAGSFAVPIDIPETLQGVNTIKALSNSQLYATATYTVTTPAITLTPSGATTAPIVPGLPVNVFGTNFKANDIITILVNGVAVAAQGAPITVNNMGEFGCVFIFPQVSPGTSTIKVQSNEGYFAATSVTVSATSLTVNPATGPDSIVVHLAGTNLDANAPVSLYLDGNLQAATTTTNGVGFFSMQYTIPSGLQYGAHTIRAQTSDSSVANATFTVSLATLTLSPATGSPGTVMNVAGSNFDVKDKVSFLWNGVKITPKEGTITTSSSGSFSANFIVPNSSPVGVNQLEATTGDISTAVASFTIAAPTLTLTGTLTANTVYSGSRVTISGTNFVGSKKVQVMWDNNIVMESTPSTIMTSSSGSFTASILIPESRGFHSISMVASGQPVGASIIVSVGAPSIIIAPTNAGTPDSEIQIIGTSFLSGTKVFAYWDNSTSAVLVPNIEVLDNGSFTASAKIPSQASPGYHTITVKRLDDESSVLSSTSFLVTAGELAVSSENMNLGSKITVTGKQFNSDAVVLLYWDETEIVGGTVVKTDSIGGFSYVFSAPITSYPGKHVLRAATSNYYTDSFEITINEPTLEIQADAPRIGDIVVLVGHGFMPNSDVTLTIRGLKFGMWGNAIKTDATGSFKISVKIPFIFSNKLQINAKTSLVDQTSSGFEISNQYYKVMKFAGNLISLLLLVYIVYRVVRFLWLRGYITFAIQGTSRFIQDQVKK